MSETIRVELGSRHDGADLVRALAARGLVGTLLDATDHCEVEIGSQHEETERLLFDVLAALESWLVGHEPRTLTVRVGERAYTVSQRKPDRQ